jgi:hypothetical protein
MANSLKIGAVTIPAGADRAHDRVSDLPFRRAASRCGASYVATDMVACDSFARGRPMSCACCGWPPKKMNMRCR